MPVDFSKVPSPCFLLDEKRLRNNLKLIKDVRERSGAEIILAFKGFSMWSVFPILNEYGFIHATASSLNEARLAVEEMGSEAHTYAPVYSPAEFEEIIKLSSHITFNSLNQYQRFYPMVKASEKKVSLGLRINPEFSTVETDMYNPCAPGSRLGILVSKLERELPEGIEGLHFHALCESNSHDLEKVLNNFVERCWRFLPSLKWVNMGGGHLMTHEDYDVEFLISLIQRFRLAYPNLQVILEPGSAFVWDTGYLVSTVMDIVENKGIKTAILDVSFTAHMPDCLEMPYKPYVLGSLEPTGDKPTYRLGGNSCLAGDYMEAWSFEKELNVGDKIVFNDMIHYTMVKTTLFNGVQHPSIGIWSEKNQFKMVKHFEYHDFKNKLS